MPKLTIYLNDKALARLDRLKNEYPGMTLGDFLVRGMDALEGVPPRGPRQPREHEILITASSINITAEHVYNTYPAERSPSHDTTV